MRIAFASFALIPLLLVAPVVAARTPDSSVTPFDAIAFFTGHTEGTGRLKIAMRAARAIDVHGYGRVTGDGTIILVQTVEEQGKARKRREWRIREVSPGRYTGTLTDAVGPIAGALVGARLKLSYRMKGGRRAVQWLDAAPDGRSAHNRMTVSKMGVPVAHLDETIRRTGP